MSRTMRGLSKLHPQTGLWQVTAPVPTPGPCPAEGNS